MKKKLEIAADKSFALPLSFVTATCGILGKKRKGKSYKAGVIAEEMLAAGQQIIVMDPTGAWYGMRSSADGRRAGYPITILGGDHGDVPLDPSAGVEIADAIVADRFSAILDMTDLTKGEEQRFCAAFLDRLYRKNKRPVHLFMDEADVYCPQRPFGEEAKTLGAAQSIVRRGGLKGIGITMITQRPAVLNKDVLSQIDTLILLGMNHPADLDSIDDWVKAQGDPATAKELRQSLVSMPRGDAWVWAPTQKILQRVTFRDKTTFDSGRTPEVGESVAPPKVLAPVDLERLGETIAAAAQRVKDSDPKALRGRVVELERRLAEATNLDSRDAEVIALKRELAKKPVPKIDTRKLDASIKAGHKLLERYAAVGVDWYDGVERATSVLRGILDRAGEERGKLDAQAERIKAELAHVAVARGASVLTPITPGEVKTALAIGAEVRRRAERPASMQRVAGDGYHPLGGAAAIRQDASAATTISGGDGLKPVHLRLLSAIAWWESVGVPEPDIAGVAFAAEVSSTSSSFENNRSWLRARGYIEYPSGGHIRLTERGRAVAPRSTLATTNEALHAAVIGKVPPVIGRMLRALIEAHPRELALEELAKRAGASPTSSSFENNRSWLRARGLADYPRTGFMRATEILFPWSAT